MIPSRRPGGIHPRPGISHRLQHCDAYARSLNLPLFSRINLIRSMKALQLMDVQVNVIFIAACCRRAEEERKLRRRAAGGRRGRSISMSAHRLKLTASKWRPVSTVLRSLCYAALVRKSLNDIAFTLSETQKMGSATAALLKFVALARVRETTNTIRLAATRSA